MGQTLDVIWVAVRAILQVFLVVGIGAVMSRMGFLGRETLTSLGKMSYYMFIPALAFYKICVGVRLDQLLDAWPFLIYPSIIAGFGFLIGIAVTRIFKVESKPLRHSIVVTLMFGNYGNLPLSLLETITNDVWPFTEDPASTQRSLAYASIFLSTASLWLWTFGPWYIKSSRDDANLPSSTDSSQDTGTKVEEDKGAQDLEDGKVVPLSLEDDEDSHSIRMKPTTVGSSDQLEDHSSNPSSLEAFQPRLPFRQRVLSRAKAIWQKVMASPVWSILTPSTMGCILAMLLLTMGPVHRLMFTPPAVVTSTSPSPSTPTFTNGTLAPGSNTTVCSPIEPPTATEVRKPPLKFIADSIGSLATACVPISLLMLGSNLYTTVKGQITRSRMQREANATSGEVSTQSVLPLSKRVLFGAVFGRLALLPAVCFCFTWLVHKAGILPADPLVTVILAVEGCMPSAINLIILAQLQDDQLVVEQLSTILLVQYLFCTFSIFTTIALGIKMFT